MLTNTCRIALIGPANVGKTVFLTSMVNHLQLPRSGDFSLGPGVQLKGFEHLPTADPGEWKPFDHEAFRAALEIGRKFPVKTKDKSQYRCYFERSDWYRGVVTTFYDLPGDRLVDATMREQSYADWSDQMLKRAGMHDELAEWLVEYETIGAQGGSPAEIADAYKRILARLWMSFSLQLSPSTFSVDLQGSTLGSAYNALRKSHAAFTSAADAIRAGIATDADWRLFAGTLGASRPCGATVEAPFAPLSPKVRTAFPDLARVFEARYGDYVARIVFPLIDTLRKCDSFIYLEDIPDILASGPRTCNERTQMIRDLLEVLNIEPGWFANAQHVVFRRLNFRSFSRRWLPRVAFAATKADMVLEGDRENLVDLLKAMTEPWLIHKSKILARYFACSAVVSAFESPHPGRLRSRLAPNGPLEEYEVPRIPPCWEPRWQAGQYNFPEVQPDWPNLKFELPRQIGLDKILNFALTGEAR